MSSPSGSGGKIARALGGMALQGLRDALSRNPSALDTRGEKAEVDTRPEPPVVAQLMIEIRSDGSHTIARGALHDLRSKESAHVHAEGQTPAQLVASLLGSLLSLPGSTFEKFRPQQIKSDEAPEPLPRSRPRKE
jgi:hypothetical protein